MSRHGPYPLIHYSPARNPWAGGGGSVSSSASSHNYHFVPQCLQGDPYWVPQPPQVQIPLQHHHLAHPSQPRLPQESRAASLRAVTPQTAPAEILPCGGHCVPCETFCHRFLQVAFAAGILSGAILTGAGLLGGPDAEVLAYIGCLTGMVSLLLFLIQSKSGRRRRPNRPPPQPPPPSTAAREEIPLTEISVVTPLQDHRLEETPSPAFREESGIPWWRRELMD